MLGSVVTRPGAVRRANWRGRSGVAVPAGGGGLEWVTKKGKNCVDTVGYICIVSAMKLKSVLGLGAILASVLAGSAVTPARASLGEHLGVISKLYTLCSALTRVQGRTVVQPAYALHSWVRADYGNYGGIPFGNRRQIRRILITEEYVYATEQRLPDLTWRLVSENRFVVQEPSRLNRTCDVKGDGRFLYKTVEDFTVMVWLHSIQKTGLLPPGPPYKVFLKSDTVALSDNCGPDPGTVLPTRSYELRLSSEKGHVLTRMPRVQRRYEWPMLCWSGEFHDR